jgi:transcriptional regulator with XRE-family HTH domain
MENVFPEALAMKRLKLARERRGLTQSELAEHIDTTQQTIARWETGKAEPSLAALRDLAICLHTTVDNLLGRAPVLEHQTTNSVAWLSGDKSGYWGNIGVRLPRKQFSTWYPITTSTMEQVFAELQCIEKESWILFQTLNNKMVICRPSRVKSFLLLDEADDGVEGDWEVGPDEVEGWPQEIYECLEYIMWKKEGVAFPEDDEGFSERLIAISTEIVDKYQINIDKLMAMCVQTRIVHTDGDERRLLMSSERLAEALIDLELGTGYTGSMMLRLDDNCGNRDVFFSLNSISLLEFPLLSLKQGLEKRRADALDGDAGVAPEAEGVGLRRKTKPGKKNV